MSYSPTMMIVPGDGATLEYLNPDTSKMEEIFFFSNVEASGGDPDETEIRASKHTAKVSSRPGVPDISIPIPSFIPHHRSWRKIRELAEAGAYISFQVRTVPSLVLASATSQTLAIASNKAGDVGSLVAAADLTWAKEPKWGDGDFSVGHILVVKGAVDGVYFMFDDFQADGDHKPSLEVRGKSQGNTAIVAAKYAVYSPQLRRGPFLAKVKNFGADTLPADGALNTTLDLTPNSLPSWAVDETWLATVNTKINA